MPRKEMGSRKIHTSHAVRTWVPVRPYASTMESITIEYDVSNVTKRMLKRAIGAEVRTRIANQRANGQGDQTRREPQ